MLSWMMVWKYQSKSPKFFSYTLILTVTFSISQCDYLFSKPVKAYKVYVTEFFFCQNQ